MALLVVAALLGCPQSFEGDEPGECQDDADNDRDGLFDCQDPDCGGASDRLFVRDRDRGVQRRVRADRRGPRHPRGVGRADLPDVQSPATVTNAAAGLDAFEDQFDRGMVAISTHGDSYFSAAAAPARWSNNSPASVVVMRTRQPATATAMALHAAELLSGQLVVATGGNFAYTPSWVTGMTAGDPMPRSVVGLHACRSAWNVSMVAAYLAGGAGYFFGFTDYVFSTYARDRATTFWTQVIGRGATGIAWALASSPWVEDAGGTYPMGFGNALLFLGAGQLANPGFEAGDASWSSWGEGTFDTAFEVGGWAQTNPPEGSQMGLGMVQAPYGGAYVEWQTPFCPVVGDDVTIGLDVHRRPDGVPATRGRLSFPPPSPLARRFASFRASFFARASRARSSTDLTFSGRSRPNRFR